MERWRDMGGWRDRELGDGDMSEGEMGMGDRRWMDGV